MSEWDSVDALPKSYGGFQTKIAPYTAASRLHLLHFQVEDTDTSWRGEERNQAKGANRIKEGWRTMKTRMTTRTWTSRANDSAECGTNGAWCEQVRSVWCSRRKSAEARERMQQRECGQEVRIARGQKRERAYKKWKEFRVWESERKRSACKSVITHRCPTKATFSWHCYDVLEMNAIWYLGGNRQLNDSVWKTLIEPGCVGNTISVKATFSFRKDKGKP